MKTYIVKKGKSDFKPIDSSLMPIFLNKIKHIKINFKLDSSCWYDWGTDADKYDWNKITGVSSYFSRNDKESIMVVWRPSAIPGKFEISIFTNWLDNYLVGQYWTNPKQGALLTVDAGEEVEVILKLSEETIRNENKNVPDWHIVIRRFNTQETVELQHIKGFHNWGRKTGAFFGGNNNSPGPYGGVAPHSMLLDYSFEIVK